MKYTDTRTVQESSEDAATDQVGLSFGRLTQVQRQRRCRVEDLRVHHLCACRVRAIPLPAFRVND